MASGDFGDCKLQCAYLSGRTAVSQLDTGDQALAGQCVNEAYLECYMPVGENMVRPRWAKQSVNAYLGAPLTFTVSVTQGSNVFTITAGGTPPANRVGSTVQIGSNYYRYAGLNGTAQQLVESVLETTGSYTMTMWGNSYVLDPSIVEIDQDPIVVSWGVLLPMNGQGEDFKWRQITYGDFWWPTPQGAGLLSNINWPGGISAPQGDPLFYYVSSVQYITANPIAFRFVVQPIPTQARSVTFNAWHVPAELANDSDRPTLPADVVTRVLFPLIRERWAMIYKKYAGMNLPMLMQKAAEARAILQQMANGQRGRPVRAVTRNC